MWVIGQFDLQFASRVGMFVAGQHLIDGRIMHLFFVANRANLREAMCMLSDLWQ